MLLIPNIINAYANYVFEEFVEYNTNTLIMLGN